MVQLENVLQELACACSQVPGIHGRRGGKLSRKIHSIMASVVLSSSVRRGGQEDHSEAYD